MDVKDAENSPKIGDAFISLDEKSKAVFYEVVGTDTDVNGGAMWIQLKGIQFEDKIYIPLLFLDKSFAKVNESTIKALFGERNKNGNAKQETGHPQGSVKSIHRESQRRSVAKRTAARVVEVGKGHRSQSSSVRITPESRNRAPKRD